MKYVSACIRLSPLAGGAAAASLKDEPPLHLSICGSICCRVAQPDRLGRRSSTFTLPPCQTSRAVLVNEVAVSYCSVKHLKLAWGRRGRRSDGGIKLLRRKDELGKEKCWFAAAPLMAQVLFLWRFSWNPTRRRMGERRAEWQSWGGCWACCFAFFTRTWNSFLPPTSGGRLFPMHMSLHLAAVGFSFFYSSMLFIFQFSI